MEKKFYNEKFFIEKNFFYREKLYLISEIHILTQKIFMLQIKYESFLNINSFRQKSFF